MTDEAKREAKAGKAAGGIWPAQPNKAARKEVDARWTVKIGKTKPGPGSEGGGGVQTRIAIPVSGYKSHIGVDRRFGVIGAGQTTNAAAGDGRMSRRGLLSKENTAAGVWADSACRSKANEAFMDKHGFASRVHRVKPRGKPMPAHIARGNATRSKVRARVEHVFAERNSRMGLTIRTIGLARAEATITPANIADNMKPWLWLAKRMPGGIHAAVQG